MLKRFLTTPLLRFSTTTQPPATSPSSTTLSTPQPNLTQTPVYLKPYDKSKYQVPLNKIKKNSGYALLQIQPFPRARILKLGYKILEQVQIGIPQDYPDRIFIQQRTKYIMEMTDKITDVEQLQDFFATDSIEFAILGLTRNLEYIRIIRKMKPWESKHQENNQEEQEELKKITSPQSAKYPIYKKGERPTSKFLDA